ncbi:MAG: rhomboid family intramembrane serine protease [Sphingobacteriales bacterium]|nr:rhomboid family intramembrane serine protease [Sphingobacteriales bacterium]MBI3719654.1 rhomboid family intramembrane serine protease [Sphingobacteriales bacterium]
MSITVIIIIITCLVSVTAFSNQKIIDDLIFYPPAVANQNQWYRFFSCGLIHADFMHLAFNMYALYLFGQFVEAKFIIIFGDKGKLLYILMYVAALGFCLLPTYSKNKNNYHYRSLGASGAVSAIVFAYILLNPLQGLGLLFIPIYIAGFIFGFLYLFISGILEKKNQGNINHSAHIWGAVFGVAFLIIAARLFSDTKILSDFIEQIRNASPSQFISFGRY